MATVVRGVISIEDDEECTKLKKSVHDLPWLVSNNNNIDANLFSFEGLKSTAP